MWYQMSVSHSALGDGVVPVYLCTAITKHMKKDR